MAPLPALASRLLRCFTLLAGLLLSVAVWSRPVHAEPSVMPQPALLPHYSPLCDSNLIGCLDIDDFGAHLYAHLIVLPRTDQRDTAAFFPYGVSMGLFGRFAGGVSTDFSFWQVDGQAFHQHGPLRLNATVLLWPFLPFSQAPAAKTEEGGATHFQPVRHLRVGLHYEHQLRIGPFDGPNTLGFLADLAALRLVANRTFGPVELSASVGALYDWHGAFATGEASFQIGLYLPFFRALKIYGEALGRGWPGYVKKGDDGITPVLAALLSPDGVDPIHRQSVLGFGLSFRPQARVDLGVSVQMGLGGVAPSAVIVRFLVLSAGKTYQGRSATPIAQLAADATVEAARALKEYIASLPIDPTLDEECLIRDWNGKIMGSFGKPTKNKYYCEEDGFRVPINHILLRDRRSTRLCRDFEKGQLTDCLLEKHGNKWIPVRRPRLTGSCEMYDSDGTFLGRLGSPSPDGRSCRTIVEKKNGGYSKEHVPQDMPIGELFYTDADRSRVCVDPALRRCFMQAPEGRKALAVEDGERFTYNYLKHLEEKAAKKAQTVKDIADGKVTLTTIREEAQHAGEAAIKIGKDPKKAAQDTVTAIEQAKDEWDKKTPEEKQDAIAEGAAGVTVEAVQTAATSGAGRLVGGAGKVGEAAEEFSEAGKAGKKLAKAGAKAEQTAAGGYGHLPDHPSVGPGKRFTRAQRRNVLDENAKRAGGELHSDTTGEVLQWPKQHKKGVTPPRNEAHVDHATAKARGGKNSYKNAQVISREENLKKGAK